jgi:hypothetical protein
MLNNSQSMKLNCKKESKKKIAISLTSSPPLILTAQEKSPDTSTNFIQQEWANILPTTESMKFLPMSKNSKKAHKLTKQNSISENLNSQLSTLKAKILKK